MSDYTPGKYYKVPTWSNDKSTQYYQGAKLRYVYPAAKIISVLLFGLLLAQLISAKISLIICLTIVLTYQQIIARCMGFVAIPIMD